MENQTAEAGPSGKVFVFDFFQGTREPIDLLHKIQWNYNLGGLLYPSPLWA